MDEYQKKEEARMALEEAMRQYKVAAEEYGMDDYDIANEINDCFHETNIGLTAVIKD